MDMIGLFTHKIMKKNKSMLKQNIANAVMVIVCNLYYLN